MKNNLKGGKADKMSVEDIAKKHGVSVEEIEKEIKIGMKVEREHSSDKEDQREITIDHISEDPKYYSDPKTGLIAKEKQTDKNKSKMFEESKKLMALAGIKEGDKKFLKNESFSEEKPQVEKDNPTLYPDRWKEMDGMFMHPDRIPNYKEKLEEFNKKMEEEAKEANLIVDEFIQEDVEPGEDDKKIYKIKMPRKK